MNKRNWFMGAVKSCGDGGSFPRVPFDAAQYEDVEPEEFISRVIQGQPWIILATTAPGSRLIGSFVFYAFDPELPIRLTKPLVARTETWKRTVAERRCVLLRFLRGQHHAPIGWKTTVPYTGTELHTPRIVELEGVVGRQFQYLIWTAKWNTQQVTAPIYQPSILLEKAEKHDYQADFFTANDLNVQVAFY